MGEYKEGTGADGNCIKCPKGVSTPAEGSISAKECKGGTAGHTLTVCK